MTEPDLNLWCHVLHCHVWLCARCEIYSEKRGVRSRIKRSTNLSVASETCVLGVSLLCVKEMSEWNATHTSWCYCRVKQIQNCRTALVCSFTAHFRLHNRRWTIFDWFIVESLIPLWRAFDALNCWLVIVAAIRNQCGFATKSKSHSMRL